MVPRHIGIKDNEYVNKLARETTNNNNKCDFYIIPLG